jgi:hypothetical protein
MKINKIKAEEPIKILLMTKNFERDSKMGWRMIRK